MEYSAAKYLSSLDCSLYTLDNLEDRHYALGFRKGTVVEAYAAHK
jgi:hypothetical protein